MTGERDTTLHLSIGEVLAFIQEEFPDVTISKIRFLESQGLIQPDRTASGYRKFYESDIERLQWILRQQRDHFLPLKVIRKMLDEGVDRFDPGGGAQPTLWTPTDDDEAAEHALEAEPAAVGGGPPRSAAHPAVASSPNGAARDTPATAGATARSAGGKRPRAADATAGGGPASAGTASGRPAPATDGPPPRRPGRSTGTGGDAGSGSGRSRAADPTPGDGDPVRPTHETPADVVAALQEDPRRGRKGTEPADDAPTVRPARRKQRKERATTDPATQLSTTELCEAAGIEDTLLAGLVQYGLVVGQQQGNEQVYGADALEVARLAARYAELGVEPRHLRMYLVSAEREAGFVEQLAVPLLKQRNPQARSQAGDLSSELTTMGADLHAALLRRELGPDLGV